MTNPPLPLHTPDQPYWNVSALEAGKIHLPERFFVTEADPTVSRRCPTLAFVLRHSVTGKTLVYDLGLRKNAADYPPAVQRNMKNFYLCEVAQDVSDSLRAGGLEPSAVDYVVISHFHFDHSGDPAPFLRATFLVGAGGEALLDNGYPGNPNSTFQQDLVPRERTEFLDIASLGAQLGPFPHALDYFHDGSLYIVDAPGHVAGHVNVLVRTRPEGGWLYFGSDTCHDIRLLNGERQICVHPDGSSAHADLKSATEHIARVRTLRDEYDVKVVLAHEYKWDEEHRDEYFPGTLKI